MCVLGAGCHYKYPVLSFGYGVAGGRGGGLVEYRRKKIEKQQSSGVWDQEKKYMAHACSTILYFSVASCLTILKIVYNK